MEVQIKRSYRKTVTLKINEKGEVFVLCPLKYSLKNINKLLLEKQAWITKHLQLIQQKQLQYTNYYNYNKVMFLGESYDINPNNSVIEIGENKIKLRKNADIKKTLKQWLIKQANSVILSTLDQISDYTHINYKTAKIISARKKWGSCDNLKNINLNFRLIMLPIEAIEYVCIHELSHIKHMNHSTEFWNNVKNFMPNYKQIENLIKKYSFTLELF